MQLRHSFLSNSNWSEFIIKWWISVSIVMISFSAMTQNNLQNIQFKNITRSEGLPNNNVNRIVTDKFGFMWLATSDGLCKYYASGKIQVYKANDPNINDGLRSSYISCIYVDSENNLWVGTRYGGLSRINLTTETWKTFVYDSLDITSLSNDEILCITEDKNGNICVGTEDGLNIYQKENDSFIRYLHNIDDEKSISAKAVLDIFIDKNGWLWAGTWSGGINLMIEDPAGDQTKNYFKRFDPSKNAYSQNIWTIFQDKEDRFWLGTNMGGLYVMDLPKNANNLIGLQDWEPRFFNYGPKDDDPYSIAHDIILDIHQDQEDRLWFATANGICHVEPHEIPSKITYRNSDTIPRIKFYKHISQYKNATSLIGDYVTDIMEDSAGIMWFSTHGGISQFSVYNNQFDNYILYEDQDAFPNTQNMYVDPNNTVWLAANNIGLVKFDQKKSTLEVFDKLKDPDLNVSSIYSPDDIRLYIATNTGIAVYNLLTESIKYFPAPDWLKLKFEKFTFVNILKDQKNRLWVALETGLFTIDESTGHYEYYNHDPQDPKSLSDRSVTDIHEDYKGNIWVSSYKGLSKYKYQDSIVQFDRIYQSDEDDGLPNDRILHLLEYDKKLYLGTTNGLCVLDIETNKFKEISNIEKYSIQGMLVSDAGVIWGSTTEGIFSYDVKNDLYHLNEKEDGLGSTSFRQNSISKDKDGNFYFGNKIGFAKLDPNNITGNTTSPEVYITEIKSISPKGTNIISGLNKENIVLSHDNYSLSFNYEALSYYIPEKNKYAYKLEGFDEEWAYPESNIPAVYTNLDHGEYTFKVKASNNNGYWNEIGSSALITIKPALWETWYFKLLVSILAGLIIFLALQNYTKRIQSRNKNLKQYNENLNREIEKRNKFEIALRNMNEELKRSNSELEQFAYIASHDLQEPLRITGSFIDLLADRYKDVLDDNAFKYIDFAKGGIGRMGLLIKNLLTFSKVGGTVLEFQDTSIKQIVEEKLLDLARLIEEKNVTINLGVLPTIKCEKNQMAMLFYNLINNAIKFNNNPNPVLTISQQNSFDKDFYSFYVADNGIGIDPKHQEKIFEIFKRLHDKDAYEGTGIGLALCKKIITRHGGKIWVESKLGRGTTFYFTIAKDVRLEAINENAEQSVGLLAS